MLFEWFWLLTNKQTDAFMTDSSRFYYKKFLLNGFNPCLVGGGGTPSLTSCRAVNNYFYDLNVNFLNALFLIFKPKKISIF